MAKPGLLGAQTKLYSDAGKAAPPVLPALKPSGTAGAYYSEHIGAPATPIHVGSVAADSAYQAQIKKEIAEKAIKDRPKNLQPAVSYQSNLETEPEKQPSGIVLDEPTEDATAMTAAAPSAVATNDSYLNFLDGQVGYLDAAYKAEKDRIDEETRGLLAQIETKRQRAVVDADSAYELNKATHGTQAERLASMGLTGSGYSDHLESRAYAASRGEVQAANASALDATNEVNVNATNQKLAAGVTYQNALRESEAEKAAYIESKFDSLNAGAATGVYSQEQLNAYADYYGFDDSKRDVLDSTANAYQTALAEQKTENEQAKMGAYYTNYMDLRGDVISNPSAYSDEVIDKGIGITYSEKEAAALKADRDAEKSRLAIETIDTNITSGNYASAYEAADVAYENKFIDANAYQSKNFEIVLTKCKAASTVGDVPALEAEIERLAKAGKISAADKSAAVEYLYATAGKVLLAGQDGIIASDTAFPAVINGETYYINASTDNEVKSAFSETLTKIVNANGEKVSSGAMVKLGEKIYLCRFVTRFWSGKKELAWIETKPTDEFCETYDKACSYQPKPTVPKHTA